MKKTALLCAALALTSGAAHARPISYPGGFMLMLHNDGSQHGAEVDYTVTPKLAFGLHSQYDSEDDYQMHTVTMNNLLWRKNFPDAQANLFLMSGIGYAQTLGAEEQSTAAHIGIEADWENRRFYTLYENRYVYAGDVSSAFTQKARLGVAPYVAESGALHTWFIVQVDHMPARDDKFTVTPLVRLFKDTNLVEAGISDDGDILLNWTHQF